MSSKNPSGFSSYSYEVTFGAGTLGINLQATRSGKGVYVDSFHRPADNSVLPAEGSGYIKLGDIVLAINGEDVSDLSLSELPKVLERAKRPVTIKFERGSMEFSFTDVVRDPRKLPWFMQYIVDKFGIEEAVHEQAKLMLWLECEQYIENELNVPDGDYSDQALMILRKFFRPDSTFSLLVYVPENVRSTMLTALAEAEDRAHRAASSSNPPTPVSAGLMYSSDTLGNLGDGGSGVCTTPLHHGDRSCSPELPHHKLYRDAQRWAERDMKTGSFLQFCSSMVSARMVGNLRYSPPFVKISLLELLMCDKKSVFLLLHMCHAKRHGILHCYNLLKNRPEENIEGGVRAAEEMLRVAISCVHVLGLEEGRLGVEDLPMLTRLDELLPSSVEHPSLLTKPMPWKLRALHSTGTGSHHLNSSYLDSLHAEMTLSIPLSEAMKSLARSASASVAIQEIRRCLRALRTAILRELSTEIVPKFFASNEFEILLWELDAHKLYIESENRLKRLDEAGCSADSSFDSTDEDAELAKSFMHMVKKQSAGGVGGSVEQRELRSHRSGRAEVPDGAVQRLLRKLAPSLPSSITMHRAPLDLLEEMVTESKQIDDEPLAWLVIFDTQGGRLQFPALSDNVGGVSRDNHTPDHTPGNHHNGDTAGSPTGNADEQVKVLCAIPLPVSKGTTCTITDSSQIIPDGITSFVVPSGKWAHEVATGSSTSSTAAAQSTMSLFNMVVATRDSSLMYGCTLLGHRVEKVRIPVMNHAAPVDVDGDDVAPNRSVKSHRSHLHTPSSLHRSHRPPPHTPKTVFKPLPSTSVAATPKSVLPQPDNTPARTGAAVGGYGDWIGQMSSIKNRSSPFLDRFKGGISNLATLTATAQAPAEPALSADARGSDTDESSDQSATAASGELGGSRSDSVNESGGSREITAAVQAAPAENTKDVDLEVCLGVCILSRVPCINALRIPLSKLATNSRKLAELMRWARPDGTTATDMPSPTEQAENILQLMESADQDSLATLRHYYDHSIASIKAPSVLRCGGAQDFDVEMILRTLTPKNFVTVLIAFILEYKIVIVSSKLTVLTAMGEFLKSIISPLRWSHVYVPLVPKKISEQILQCPTPFFLGVHREYFDPSSTPNDVIILDMDSDACRITADLAKALYAGRRLAKELECVLRPEISFCDDISSPMTSAPIAGDAKGDAVREALRLCKLFVADVMVGVEVCCTHAVDHDELVVLFDEDMFSSYKARRSPKEESLFPLDKAFLAQLLRTQSFSLCVAGTVLRKVDPESRPPSRPSSPFVSIPTPSAAGEGAMPVAPVQLFKT